MNYVSPSPDSANGLMNKQVGVEKLNHITECKNSLNLGNTGSFHRLILRNVLQHISSHLLTLSNTNAILIKYRMIKKTILQ